MRRLELQLALHRVDRRSSDREAETEPGMTIAVGPVEPLEDPGHRVLGDSRPGVGHPDLHVAVVRVRCELDSAGGANEDRGLQYAQSLSQLQDLDYSRALSDFSRQQLALDAAQKSFVKISGLSLFNYL